MAYTTKQTLLRGIHANDEKAWEQFQAFYSPLIYLCGYDCGLHPDEIADLKQEVLLEVFNHHVVDKYDKERGRFRDYFRTVIRRKALRLLEKRKATVKITEENTLSRRVDDWDKKWEDEYQQFLLSVAMDELKEHMSESAYMAFDMYVTMRMPAQQVAEMMNITTNNLYVIRTRGLKLLKEIVDTLKQLDNE